MAAIAESRRNFRCVCSHDEMNPKRRSTMEDCHRIIESLGGDSNLSYFGVYDGHGGRKIVDFLEEALENLASSEVLLSALGEKNITSYLKLKEKELKDFNSKETFSKKDPITEWEKTNTLDC